MHFPSTLQTLALFSGLALAAPAPQADTDTATSTITDLAAATAVHAVPATATPVPLDDVTKAGGIGQANVRNSCGFPVYVYVCGQNPPTCGPVKKLAANGGTFSEGYKAANNGRSIKIGRVGGEGAKPVLQFEYTNTGTGQVAYDLSEVNGKPFGPYGFTLTSSNPQCFQKHCPKPGSHAVCPWVFTNPTNGHVADCPVGDNIGVTLCG